jgi:AAA+ superfamily predicted ATPase
MDNKEVKRRAIQYAKDNKKKIVKAFANPSIFPPEKKPISVFMAGSPGAGKTEFAKNLINRFIQKEEEKIVHIDADKIREIMPGYNGKNAYLFQAACSIAMERIHDNVLKKTNLLSSTEPSQILINLKKI